LSESLMSSSVDLSIIIVSWNVWDLLRSCLEALERISRPSATEHSVRSFGSTTAPATFEVIVVDSASQDVTVDGVRAKFPWVRLLASAENLGFTRGNNRGFAEARGEFIFFLNPDTEILASVGDETMNTLTTLFTAIRGDATVGIVGPQLRYADGTLQSSRRRFPTPLTGFFESTWLAQLWPNNPWARHLHMTDWPATIRQDVDWLMGAAMLCRRAALETPPFDEGFFMYSEELDLCRRVKAAGWRVVYVPEAVLVHYEGRSSEQVKAARHIHFNTSKVRYVRKWFGPIWAETLRRYLLLEFGLQIIIETVKAQVGHKPALRQERIAAYQRVLASGLQESTR